MHSWMHLFTSFNVDSFQQIFVGWLPVPNNVLSTRERDGKENRNSSFPLKTYNRERRDSDKLTHGWFMLMYGRNQDNIVKQLSSNSK